MIEQAKKPLRAVFPISKISHIDRLVSIESLLANDIKISSH